MKYILDASVAVKWVLGEKNSDKAICIIENARKQIDELIAPNFFPAECGHALFRAERKKDIAVGEAQKCLIALLADCPTLYDFLPVLPRASTICQHLRTGFYDAIYMALAEQEGCQLITADSKLVKSAQVQYPYVVDLSTFP